MKERRQDPRIKATGSIKLFRPNSGGCVSGDFRLGNLSWKGLSFITDTMLKRGEAFVFKINPDFTPITVTGVICHIQHAPGIYVCGVKITHIDFLSRPAMRSFLAKHHSNTKHQGITIGVGCGFGLISGLILGLPLAGSIFIAVIAALGYYLYSPMG